MFVAEILSIDADDKYIDEKGAFDISKCDLITYANGKYFLLGKQIGKFGYSVEKKKTKLKRAKQKGKKKKKWKKALDYEEKYSKIVDI